MPGIFVHIGAPRTGTTVLQKYIFPKLKEHQLIQKIAHNSTGNTTSMGQIIGNPDVVSNYIESLDQDIFKKDTHQILDNAIMPILSLNASLKSNKEKDNFLRELTGCLFAKLQAYKKNPGMPIFISTERLCDTSASLRCYSKHSEGYEKKFMIYSLVELINMSNSGYTNISLCLREPIGYLRSKYLRTYFMRENFNERPLNPNEYIQKQATLESSHPGSSALAPSMHKEFIQQLQRYAFVKAFGFQELLKSDDVFSLMGLQGEDKFAFDSFPRENKLPLITKEEEQIIESTITQSLKQYGFYNRIMKAQMFE